MKIAVTSKGNRLDAQVDPRFGRCQTFIVVETEDMSFEAVDNSSAAAGGGAGIQAAQLIADKDAEVLLTGNCGPNAFKTLEAAGIKVAVGVSGSIQEAVEEYKNGKLTATNGPSVESHNGMNA
jgi:predicted Fe-Mo cluster-binding NifX family protein